MTNIYQIIEKYKPEIIKSFTTLEALAEPSFQEFKTTQFIIDELSKTGISNFTNLSTGCFGTLDFNKDSTVAIRADIDALPYNDEKTIYRHLCGHHFHAAALLETIKIIVRENLQLNSNFRFIFQPAEERVSGAEFIIKNGGMKNVTEIYGLHVDPELYVGEIYVEKGAVMAGARHFSITMSGKSTHAAYPHLGADPIVASANFIQTAQAIVSRMVDPLKSAVVTFGSITGGSAHNIIPESVTIKGTFRFLEEENSRLIETKLKHILSGIDQSFGTSSTINIDKGTYPVLNDEKVSQKLKSILKGEKFRFIRNPHLSMGGEDFCFYGKLAPSLFIKFGTRTNDKIIPIHNKDFCVPIEPLFDAIYMWIKILTF
ncbi:amidohydrolase [Deferribacteraceae bacterium V6Fe1]|nr:amidohydrolase [Deferribacteraceae bacterium V6Fe1]